MAKMVNSPFTGRLFRISCRFGVSHRKCQKEAQANNCIFCPGASDELPVSVPLRRYLQHNMINHHLFKKNFFYLCRLSCAWGLFTDLEETVSARRRGRLSPEPRWREVNLQQRQKHRPPPPLARHANGRHRELSFPVGPRMNPSASPAASFRAPFFFRPRPPAPPPLRGWWQWAGGSFAATPGDRQPPPGELHLTARRPAHPLLAF